MTLDLKKEKIMVSAYACEPGYGTEIGVGWHWVLEMSKYFDVWVLTRESNKETIENWLSKNPIDREIHFVYYDLPKKARFWKKGLRGVRTYYVLWQRFSNKLIKKTMEENNIGIYHLLTYGNSLWPVSKYGMKQTFIWGPTGGVDTIPSEYSKHYNVKARLVEFVRRSTVRLLKVNVGFKKRCKNANLILCKSNNMFNAIPDKYRDKATLFTDVAVEAKNVLVSSSESSEKTNFVAVGRLDAWRGFDILIEAFAKSIKKNNNIHLKIVGDGKDRNCLEKLIEENEMSNYIELTGLVSMSEYEQEMQNADVVINPSLKEGAVTVAFDSIAMKKPIICIETGGYTRYFNDERGIVLKLKRRDETIDDLSEAILKMTDKSLREKMSQSINEVGDNFDWAHKGEEIRDIILKTIK